MNIEMRSQIQCDWNMNLVYMMSDFSTSAHDRNTWNENSAVRKFRDHPGEYITKGNSMIIESH